MNRSISLRLLAVVDALPLEPGMRVLEIGGAPGVTAREVARRVGESGHVMMLDRSASGIALTRRVCEEEIASGVLSTLLAPVEDFVLPAGVGHADLAFACRVGALDGRHPRLYEAALECIRSAVVPGGALYVDTGDPLTRIALD